MTPLVHKTLTSGVIHQDTQLPIKWIAKHFHTATDGSMVGSSNLYNIDQMKAVVAIKLSTPQTTRNPKQAELSIQMLQKMQEYLNCY